jgi:23S rRNA maturation mini-RNase III
MEVIAKILGDTVKQVRETYAKMLDNTVADEMKKSEKRVSRRSRNPKIDAPCCD